MAWSCRYSDKASNRLRCGKRDYSACLPAAANLTLLRMQCRFSGRRYRQGVSNELVPDRNTHTYLTIGWSETGEAVLRRTLCCVDAPSTLRLAALNGKSVSRSNFGSRNCPQQRDCRFAETSAAVDSGLSQLVALFPEQPRKTVEFQVNVHRYLDEALATAHAYLSQWDPFIEFVGLPNEAQFGFALKGLHGGSGELVSRRPDMWVLRWKSPDADIYEEWAVVLPDSGAPCASASA